jgi:hypothetical protein
VGDEVDMVGRGGTGGRLVSYQHGIPSVTYFMLYIYTYIGIHDMGISSCQFIVHITGQIRESGIRQSSQFLPCLIAFRVEFFSYRQKGH